MGKNVQVGTKFIGEGHPNFIIAEIGINHNGDIALAKKLIDIAVIAGCDAVKFQKRTVDIVYTKEELERIRPNNFGETNGDLKRGLEFGFREYEKIIRYCEEKKIIWFASCWDKEALDFIEKFNPPCYKIASACLTDDELLKKTKATGKPILLSTGMSTMEQIEHAVEILGENNLVIYHCTSTYPTDHKEINLSVINTLKKKFSCPIGFSGHERGLIPSVMAVAMGAASIERHITADRTLWGSDHAASVEPNGLFRMVRDIRQIPDLIGDGVKKVYNSEKSIIEKLRRVDSCKV